MSTLSSPSQKHRRLIALSRKLGTPQLPTTVDELLSFGAQGDALEDLIDLVEGDTYCVRVMKRYGADGEAIREMYWFLLRSGAGQMIGDKYVPCFALAEPQVLEYLLKSQKAGHLGLDIAANVVAMYQTGEDGAVAHASDPEAGAARRSERRTGRSLAATPTRSQSGTDRSCIESQKEVADSTDLTKFITGAGTRKYKDLVAHHLRRQSVEHLQASVLGETRLLSQHELGIDPHLLIETLIDHLNSVAFDGSQPRELWSMNCRDAFDFIRRSAAEHAGGRLAEILNRVQLGVKITQDEFTAHEVAFSLFQIATVNFAYNASISEEARKLMGIGNHRSLFRSVRRALVGTALVVVFFAALEYPVSFRSIAHALGGVFIVAGGAQAWTRKWQDFGSPGWFRLAARVALGIGCGALLLRV